MSERSGFLATLDGLLRARRDTLEALTFGKAALILVLFGGIYGLAMGSFWGGDGPRGLQMAYSALKVPILIGVTSLLSLPTMFVVTTLYGLRDDMLESLKALMATQGVLAIVLASFAPFTLLWYASSSYYNAALLFNGAIFGLASLFAQRALKRFYGHLIEKDARHRTLLRVWLVIYAFIGIQMGWVLRPFVGNPDDPTTFFRTEAWGNAYEAVAHNVRQVLGM